MDDRSEFTEKMATEKMAAELVKTFNRWNPPSSKVGVIEFDSRVTYTTVAREAKVSERDGLPAVLVDDRAGSVSLSRVVPTGVYPQADDDTLRHLHGREYIVCPSCAEAQIANVYFEYGDQFPIYAHECKHCGYHITESEWDKYDEVVK